MTVALASAALGLLSACDDGDPIAPAMLIAYEPSGAAAWVTGTTREITWWIEPSVAQVRIELYDTDGADGAARGAGFGAGIYGSLEEALATAERDEVIEPEPGKHHEAYARWEAHLSRSLS